MNIGDYISYKGRKRKIMGKGVFKGRRISYGVRVKGKMEWLTLKDLRKSGLTKKWKRIRKNRRI